MPFLGLLLVLVLFLGPFIIAGFAISRARRADIGVGYLSSRLNVLAARVRQIERTLSERSPTEVAADASAMPAESTWQRARPPVERQAPVPGEEVARKEKPTAEEESTRVRPVAKAEPAFEATIQPEPQRQLEEPVAKIPSRSIEPPVASKPPSYTTEPEHPSPIRKLAAHARDLEEKITANWLVWVGGIAVALAGIFFVRYAAEQGWLSPSARCILGVAFGLSLVIASEAIRRRPLERAIAAIKPDYVPQALAAAGLCTAFGSVYLAYAFYALLPPATSFGLLAAIALGGFALSLVQGPFVAAFGLVGAAATPALVSTDNPTSWGFFTYLAVIVLAAMAVADRRRWWWLVLAALVAHFAWTLIWFAKLFAVGDVVPMGTVAGLDAFASLVLANRALRKGNEQTGKDQFGFDADITAWTSLAVAGATMFLLGLESEFAAVAHWVALAAAAGVAAIARLQPRFDLALPVVCLLIIAAFGLTYLDNIAIDNLAERALGWPPATSYASERYSLFMLHAPLMAIVLFSGGLISLGEAKHPHANALSTAAVPLLLLAIGYAEFRNITGENFWAVPAVGVLIASWFAVVVVRRANEPLVFAQNVYVTAAVAAALLALTFIFDRVWLTIAYALLVVALSVVSMRVDLKVLRHLASIVALLVVARLTVNPDLRGYEFFHPLGMQWVTYGYLLPLAAFLVAARCFRHNRDDLLVTILEGGALLFAVLFVSIEVRIVMTGSIYSGAYRLPEMSLQTIAWLFSALILSIRHARYPRPFSLWGARILTLAGTAQALLLQLIFYNPVFTGEVIQGHGLFNLLILSLFAPAVLLWVLASYFGPIIPSIVKDKAGPIIALRALSMLLAFAFITEEVRVFFQGMVITPKHASLLELYITTLIWLALAVLTLFINRVRALEGATEAGIAVLGISLLMLLVGHSAVFNPVFDGTIVRGWPVLNTLLLGFIVPAMILGMIARAIQPPVQPWIAAAAYLLLFFGVTMLVKQAFQGAVLVPQLLSERESYGYSAAWIVLAAVTIFAGINRDHSQLRYAALVVLVLAVLKVFLFDMSDLSGLWRVASFLGLGLSLIGIGWIYQRFVYRKPEDAKPQAPTEPNAQVHP